MLEVKEHYLCLNFIFQMEQVYIIELLLRKGSIYINK